MRQAGRPLTSKQLFLVLWRRKLAIFAVIVLTAAASIAYLKEKHPSYSAGALVQLNSTTNGASSTSISNLKLITSRQVAETAATSLHLPASDGAALAGGLSITGDTTDQTVAISAKEASPQQAQAVANAFANSYMAALNGQATSNINTLKAQQTAASNSLNSLEPKVAAAPNNAVLNAQVQSVENQYVTATQALAIAQAAPLPATILNPAGPGASSRSDKKVVIIAVLIGLLAGAGIALILEQLDTRIREPEDVIETVGLPVLTELPIDPDARRRSRALPAIEKPQSPFAEGIRELRTSLQVLLAHHACPVIVVTSAEPGDGKTCVAANLAVSWAMSGKRTVVVAGDIRRNHLDEVFSDNIPTEGLATLLEAEFARLPKTTGTDDFSGPAGEPSTDEDRRLVWSSLWLTDVDRLMILPAGTTEKDPADLLASPSTAYLLAQLRQLADVVIIDSPPVLAVADAAIWATAADGVVLVVRADKTDRGLMVRTQKRLVSAGGNLLGVALNRSRSTRATGYGNYESTKQSESKPRAAERSPVDPDGPPPATSNGQGSNGAKAKPADSDTETPVEPS